MSSEEILRYSEEQAISHNQIISHVSGKTTMKKSHGSFSWSATGLIIGIIVIAAVLFSSGNIIPSAISERLVEETDVQYADAVESKKIIFEQALHDGSIPDDTARILKENGVLVGYYENGVFKEGNKVNGELVLKQGDTIITADNFISAVSSDLSLYNAFNNATYSRAAYYFDDDAQKVFNEIGTNRNNYTEDSDFDETMSSIMGDGSNISINNITPVEKTIKNEQTGEETIVVDYEELTKTANSNNADSFVNTVGENNFANTSEEATLNSADSLKAADTITKEQRSSLFFLGFMENISKMKAGDGNESKINEAMNFLYTSSDTEVVDVKTGEKIKVSGSPLDSPSLYAILSGNKINTDSVDNFSSDRILKIVQNKTGNSSKNMISETVASTSDKAKGTIGRLNKGSANASVDALNSVKPIIDSSLVNNSYDTIKGINAGEFLVEGAINVGKKLAKASGATAGDSAAVVAYQRINNDILAMDAKVDRKNRSPFDITSKNTFLGSIVYNMAIMFGNKSNSLLSNIKSFSNLTSKSVVSLLPKSYADATDGYLTNFGDCETIPNIGAVGSLQCSEVATFDTTTLNNPFNDAGFINFINNNTTISSSGIRTINKDSALADFILYNNQRKTPIGITDGGIIDSVSKKSSSIPLLSNILEMLKISFGTSETSKRIASGEIFVNSSSNPDWQTYKYAQRYVSLARATAALKKYSNDSTAYNTIKYFEGPESPVTAFLNSFYAGNDNLMITEVSD